MLLLAKLRPANIDAAAGAKEEIAWIVARLRLKWPDADIWLRADSGFCREDLMGWCEANNVHYVFGLARNARLEAEIAGELAEAEQKAAQSGKPERSFNTKPARAGRGRAASWPRPSISPRAPIRASLSPR